MDDTDYKTDILKLETEAAQKSDSVNIIRPSERRLKPSYWTFFHVYEKMTRHDQPHTYTEMMHVDIHALNRSHLQKQ